MKTDIAHPSGTTLFVYVEAKIVLKTAHDRIEADGVVIDLPGEIVTVELEGA